VVVADLVHVAGRMNEPTPRRGRLSRWLRAPLLHFTLIGGSLYFFNTSATSSLPVPIVISQSDLVSLRNDWGRVTGRPPEPSELDRMISQRADEEILIRQARLLGWDRNDAVIQQRLVRNLRFLDPESDASDLELLERAYAMGMHEGDLVVRRRLLERMKLAVASRVRSQPIPEETLEAYRLAHAERFMRPPLIRLTQIYLSHDLRGDALMRDAAELAATLRDESIAPSKAIARADPFLIPADLPLSSPRRLSERLGAGFAEGLHDAPLGAWSDPIHSSYGAHIVWVHDRIPEVLPPLPEILVQVRAEIHHEQEDEALSELTAGLREGIEIQVATEDGREER
jgi:hypothetical protein